MIRAADLVLLWWQALIDFWGYIWGKHGVLWTQEMQNRATNASKGWAGTSFTAAIPSGIST